MTTEVSGVSSPILNQPLLLPETADTAVVGIVGRIAQLRSQPDGPEAWKEIEFEVCLGPRTIKRYVWVLAAILRARDLTWSAIAAHPWVTGKLTEAYLRNKHARTKLPTGQSVPQFIEWYQDEIRSRFAELMAEQARRDSMGLRDLLLEILTDCTTTQRKLRAGQQLLDFDDEAPLSQPELETEALRVKIRRDNTASVDAVFKLLRLTTGSPTDITATPDEAREAAGDGLSREDLLERIQKRRLELAQLPGGAA